MFRQFKQIYADACFFFVSETDSRLSTCSSVWDDSRIFMYAASVSMIVLSYSLREATCQNGVLLSTQCKTYECWQGGAHLTSKGVIDARKTLGENAKVVLNLLLLLLVL